LPRILNANDFRRFYAAVDQADDVQHALMLRLLFFTAVRVSELCNIAVPCLGGSTAWGVMGGHFRTCA
jgi:integrase